jgi:hypothetical protein
MYNIILIFVVPVILPFRCSRLCSTKDVSLSVSLYHSPGLLPFEPISPRKWRTDASNELVIRNEKLDKEGVI